MSDRKLVIFGTGDIAQIAASYFTDDGVADVVAFAVDREFLGGREEFEGRPLVAFEDVERQFPTRTHQMFVALSYSQMNRLRARKYGEAKSKGYTLASYISPDATLRSKLPIGDNCFIFEDNTIQPYVRIGNNVTLWSGNHIGHHSIIEDHNFVSSHVVVSGHCHISSFCFLGVNSTIAHQVVVAPATLVGAGAVIAKNTETNGVYVPPRAVKLEMTSDTVAL